MTNKSLTKAENVARRIGQRKARDNERRSKVLDYYTDAGVPKAAEQRPVVSDIIKHYMKGKKQ